VDKKIEDYFEKNTKSQLQGRVSPELDCVARQIFS
jgi:hypothetical protein